MQNMVHGYDFSNVLTKYWNASRNDNHEDKSKALRWLKGEYPTKSEAKLDLGVPIIINDDDWFDYIKLFSKLFHNMGYNGFIIMIDELINVSKCVRASTRQRNYEKMLSMYNDALQGRASYLGIIMGGTPSSVENRYNGVFSYEALRSRLRSGGFSDASIINLMAPIIRIQPLNTSEIIVLLEKLTSIHSELYQYQSNITSDDIISFINEVFDKKTYDLVTPRSIIRDYIDVLNTMLQNSSLSINDVLSNYKWNEDVEEEPEETDD